MHNADTMQDPRLASTIRQELGRLRTERPLLERELLRRRRMLAASLIERHLGTRTQKRDSAAFYLSWASHGHTRLAYVPKDQVAACRERVAAWRQFRATLRRWRQVAGRMARLWRELGEAQADSPQERGP